jgi:hypothetical protein
MSDDSGISTDLLKQLLEVQRNHIVQQVKMYHDFANDARAIIPSWLKSTGVKETTSITGETEEEEDKEPKELKVQVKHEDIHDEKQVASQKKSKAKNIWQPKIWMNKFERLAVFQPRTAQLSIGAVPVIPIPYTNNGQHFDLVDVARDEVVSRKLPYQFQRRDAVHGYNHTYRIDNPNVIIYPPGR